MERGERWVTLVGTALRSLLVPKDSGAGSLVLRLREDYADFPKRYLDEVMPSQGDAGVGGSSGESEGMEF